MKTTKFQRLAALILAMVFLFCGGGVSAAAASGGSSAGNSIADIRERLNAISYNEYIQLEEFVEAKSAEAGTGFDLMGVDGVYTIELQDENGKTVSKVVEIGDEIVSQNDKGELVDKDGTVYDMSAPHIFQQTEGGTKGLFVPDTGVVTWTIGADSENAITEPTKYSVCIEYYPVVNKAAAVERILLVNGEVPFSEARQLSLIKVWKNQYPDGRIEVGKDESAEGLIEAAKKVGISATKVEEKGVTYVSYTMPEYWTAENTALIDEKVVRFFSADVDANEIRASLMQAPEWTTYEFKDSNGFRQDAFEILLTPDDDKSVSISLEGVNEPVVISKISLVPYVETPSHTSSYEDYKNDLKDKGVNVEEKGQGVVKIEAEYFSSSSSQTIYPVSDTTSAANSPSATDRTLLNTVGGDKWQSAGQWIEYNFSVSKSGMYKIATRYKQNLLDGMSTSRILHIYSEGVEEGAAGYYNGVPFSEAAKLTFNYSDDWQSGYITDGNDKQYEFYFKEGVTYTLRFEVSLGSMGDIVRRVQNSLDTINDIYLNILKITGSTPDELGDYNFYTTLPKEMAMMLNQGDELKAIADYLEKEGGSKSSMTATLVEVYELLYKMGKDADNEVARNLSQLKTYIGSLGTWLSDAKTQPLTFDYITVQPDGSELPRAKANFWKALVYEIVSFVQSFFRNYNRMGALTEEGAGDTVEVWLAYGRDQSQVIRNLINNDFTPNYGTAVNLKLVAGGTLLPSILAGMGPDAYIGIGQGDVINYAIRGALEPIEKLEGYDEVCKDFNDEAMMVLQIEDAKGVNHCYGLPETQSFTMMFIREDILADLDIEIPKTWDDVKEAIPVLQANNMQIGMSNDCKIFLYQMGGELFADNGMRVNLDSNVALEAFNNMCEMFTMYSFPYKYDFANRFRTGEMPIGFADYTGTYNHLKVFATEIEGLWSFYPLPGHEHVDEEGNITINYDSVSSVSAIAMIDGCENVTGTWNFMKWHVDEECQVDYSNEMVAILGPSAKHASANKVALESLPWTREEYSRLEDQFENLAAIPNYPGTYIIDRYTNFAFLDAFNDNQDPVASLLNYIDYINDEITRKRAEFDLETLDKTMGQKTLAQKRLWQAETALKKAKESSSYSSSYDAVYDLAMKEIAEYTTEDYGAVASIAAELKALNANLFGEAVQRLEQAATQLKSYEAYK